MVRNLTFTQDQADSRPEAKNIYKTDAVIVINSSITIKNCRATSLAANGIGIYGSLSASILMDNQCDTNKRNGINIRSGAKCTTHRWICH
jgi:hypothetical protein